MPPIPELSDEKLREMARTPTPDPNASHKAQQHRELMAQMNVMRERLPSHTKTLDDARAHVALLKEQLAASKQRQTTSHASNAVHSKNMQEKPLKL